MRHKPVGFSPEDLEAVLMHLPEPNYAHFGLVGFNYSGVLGQAERLLPKGTYLDVETEPHVKLRNPTKKRILDIYRKFHGKTSAASADFETPVIDLQSVGVV